MPICFLSSKTDTLRTKFIPQYRDVLTNGTIIQYRNTSLWEQTVCRVWGAKNAKGENIVVDRDTEIVRNPFFNPDVFLEFCVRFVMEDLEIGKEPLRNYTWNTYPYHAYTYEPRTGTWCINHRLWVTTEGKRHDWCCINLNLTSPFFFL